MNSRNKNKNRKKKVHNSLFLKIKEVTNKIKIVLINNPKVGILRLWKLKNNLMKKIIKQNTLANKTNKWMIYKL